MLKKLRLVLALTVGLAASAVSAQAQPELVIRTLGGSTRFSAPVRTRAALQRMANANRADLTRILMENGLQDIASRVVDEMAAGRVMETTVAPGTHLDWMAVRRRGRADVVRNARWGGAKPFQAFRFAVETPTAVYTFVVPYDCGNLSLAGTERKAAPASAAAAAPAPPPPAPPPPAPAPPPPAAAAPPPAPAPPPVAPPPPPPPAAAAAPAPAQGASVGLKRVAPFLLGAFGKQRRSLEGNNLLASYCDPLFGAKGGVEIAATPRFIIAPAIGVAANLDEGERTSGFAEVEFNRLIGAGFIGAGVGVWDFNHRSNATGSILVHAGAPLTKYSSGAGRLLAVVEGRLFTDNLDGVDNNYQAWAGLRYVFR